MGKVHVLLADDHTVVRQGLRKILESCADIAVVGEVSDGAAAVTAAATLEPDVVLMDVRMEHVNGIEATRQIVAAHPKVCVLVLSMYDNEQFVRQSIEAGAKGYLLKDVDDEVLVEAVLAVAAGGTYFSSTFEGGVYGSGSSLDVLTSKEREVLRLIGEGLNNRAIAERLGLSIHTIETHRKHVMEKLDLHSTVDLVRYAVRAGLVH
jgi:two-component system response regulator NreC